MSGTNGNNRALAEYPHLMTTDEVSAFIRIHPKAVERLARRGDFPGAFKAERYWRYPREGVAQYVAGQQAEHTNVENR